MMKRPRKMVYIAASIVLAAGIGLAAPVLWQQVNGPAAPDNPGDRQVITDTSPVISTGSVTIPKMELPDMNSGAAMDMIGLVVYQGNIYTQTATRIEAADAAALRGSKLGQTTGGIDEWSGKDKYIELASTIGETDIYAVKGYDPDFRIMSYKEINGEVYAELYEHMNGITVGSGADLLGKLNLEGRIASAEWESFQSWNNGLQQYAPLANDGTLASFIADLLEAQPVDAQSLMKEHIYDDEDRKVIYLKLEDNTRRVDPVWQGTGALWQCSRLLCPGVRDVPGILGEHASIIKKWPDSGLSLGSRPLLLLAGA